MPASVTLHTLSPGRLLADTTAVWPIPMPDAPMPCTNRSKAATVMLAVAVCPPVNVTATVKVPALPGGMVT